MTPMRLSPFRFDATEGGAYRAGASRTSMAWPGSARNVDATARRTAWNWQGKITKII